MFAAGGGNGAVQLAPDAFTALGAEGLQRFHGLVEFVHGVEGRGVFFHIGRDHGLHPGDFAFQPAAFNALGNEPAVGFVVLGQGVFVAEDPGDQRPGIGGAAAHGGINGGVHRGGGAAGCREAAEGQVIVPGQDGQLAVSLVQVIVVYHHAGVAVVVTQEVMHRQVGDDLVLVHDLVQVLLGVQLAEGLDQAGLVLLAHVGLGVVEDVGVAVEIVVGIDQLHVVAAHAEVEAAKAAAPAAEHAAGGKVAAGRFAHGGHVLGHREPFTAAGEGEISAGHIGEAAVAARHLGHASAVRTAAGHAGEIAEGHAVRLAGGRGRFRFGRGGGIRRRGFGRLSVGFLVVLHAELFHIEIPAVAAAAAEAQAVGLIQLALRHAVAFHEGVFQAFHRQVQAPRLAVHGDLHIAAQGGGHAHLVHQGVGQIVLHHGGVLNHVVQAQFVQAVVGHALHEVVKFHLEGVPLGTQGGHGGQGGVALGADGHVVILFPVDRDIAVHIFLGCGVGNEIVPTVHGDVNGMHDALIEQEAFVPHGMAAVPAYRFHHAPQRQRQHQHQRCGRAADAIHRFCFQHGITPYNRRCSLPALRC